MWHCSLLTCGRYQLNKRSNSVPSAALLVLSLVPATTGLTPLRDFHFHLPRAARLIAYSRRCALVSTHQTCSGPRTRSGLRPPLHDPTRPANPALQPVAAPQSQALPSKAYRRLPPQVVLLVVVWVIVVLLLSENDRTTCACVLLLLVVYILSGRMILPDKSA